MARKTINTRGMSTREYLAVVDKSVQARLKRVRKRMLPILQTGIAAGLAYWIGQTVLGHERPFFAPISVVIIIGMTGGDRISKAWDIALGCIIGVLVGDLLFYRLGDGGWQIALIVSGSILIASFFSKSQLMSNQTAIGAILIATIMPPGAEVTGIDRTMDAFVGCAVAMLTLALIPQAPMASARAEVSKVMGLMSSVLVDVAEGLSTGSPDRINEALDHIRGTQSRIDDMAAAIQSGTESTKISPFLWGTRRYLNSLALVIPPVDNAVRSARVLARRALVICEDGDSVSPKQIEIIDTLSHVAKDISEMYDAHSRSSQAVVIPRLVNELRAVAQECGMDVVEGGGSGARGADAPDAPDTPVERPTGADAPAERPVLSAYAILAQSRSLTVDLMQVCGMSRESALAALAPTSKTPAYPPEHFNL